MTREIKHHLLTAACILLAFTCTSCAEDVEDIYAPWPARFVFNQVNTTATLQSALNNPGQYCLITFPNGKYLFTGPDRQDPLYTPTATAGYVKPYGYRAGFVVGTPAVPDLKGQSIVAYDLVCPHCYETTNITRALRFSTTTSLKCTRCGCTYNLNNAGNEQSGKSRALYRYRYVEYGQATSTVSISN